MHDHMWASGGWFLGPILMLLLLAAVVAIVLYFFNQAGGSLQNRQSPQVQPKDNPVDILKIRYAKGEIDHEEFETRRKALEN
ncbi:MAG: SHOCT domain-containing protein [Granulosicoccus sp.]|nr:SHOCT domain-containing protein [Granulosicoccus sp.]